MASKEEILRFTENERLRLHELVDMLCDSNDMDVLDDCAEAIQIRVNQVILIKRVSTLKTMLLDMLHYGEEES